MLEESRAFVFSKEKNEDGSLVWDSWNPVQCFSGDWR